MELHSILKNVVAYVEVRSGNDNRSAAISQELRQLGAQVEATFTDSVTHVVFKEGMKRTWNKAMKRKIHLVSVSWIDSCKKNQIQVSEKDFVASRPEEVASPLPRMNQPVRWKKMKSMQPCDFDEELARSAERGEKKRKRMMMANRFTLNENEEATPTSSSPIPILAFDTQARGLSLVTAVSGINNTPVPDTPQSLQQRLEKMREQRLALDTNLDESPPATPKVPTDKQLQRRLFHMFSSDFMSTESSNEDDEASSKAVAELIHALDSNSERGSQSSTDKKVLKSPACVKSVHGFSEIPNACHQTHSETSDKDSSERDAERNQETSISSNKTGILQASKRISGYSRLSLNESISKNSPTKRETANLSQSPQNSEYKSRRSQPGGDNLNRKNKRGRSMSNALSSKDTNINVNFTESQHTFEKVCPYSESKLIKTFTNSDATDRTSMHLRKCMTLESDNESAKTLDVGDLENELKLEPQIRRLKSKRLSSRQSLSFEVNCGLTSVSGSDSRNMSASTVKHLQISLDSNESVNKSIHATESGANSMYAVADGVKSIECTLNTVKGHKEALDNMLMKSSSAPLKPITSRKKRNLLTETALTSLQCSTDTVSCKKSSSTSSHKTTIQTLNSDATSDISFMFGTTTSKNKEQKEKNTQQKRKQPKSKSTKVSIAKFSGVETVSKDNQPNLNTLANESLCKTTTINNTSIISGCQNNSTLTDSVLMNDMSMSIMYGNVTSRTTRADYSRRSLDEFSTSSRTGSRIKKLEQNCAQTYKPIQQMGSESVSCKSTVPKKGNETKSKSVKINGTAKKIKQKLKRKRDISSESITTDKAAKKSKDCHLSSSTDADNTLNESASSQQDSTTPIRLRHAQSLVMEHKFRPPLKRSIYSLVVTSLHREEQEIVYSVVKKLGLFQLTNNVEATSTHVICGEPRRTLNVLKAIARGCWLLRKEWVLESLEAGIWLQEESYEMNDFPSAVKSRSERQEVGSSYKVDLFSKIGAIFVSSVCTPPRKEMVHLINLCCGHVTGSETRAAVHLGDDHDPAKLVIKPEWILDCIMKLQILPTDDYIVFSKTLASQRESSPEF